MAVSFRVCESVWSVKHGADRSMPQRNICKCQAGKAPKKLVNDNSAQAILERLERLTSPISAPSSVSEPVAEPSSNTVATKLIKKYRGNKESDFTVPLVFTRTRKPLESVKRNIRRQEYLDKVSERDDSKTFALVGLLVLGPALVILGIAAATGYIQFFP